MESGTVLEELNTKSNKRTKYRKSDIGDGEQRRLIKSWDSPPQFIRGINNNNCLCKTVNMKELTAAIKQ